MTDQRARRSLRAAALVGNIRQPVTGARAKHRAAVFAYLDQCGEATGADLAAVTGLVHPGVYPVLGELIAEGLLVRVGRSRYRRPPTD